MLTIISKDITTVESGLVIHVCNNHRVMGAGVAKALYTKHPEVRNFYMKMSMDLGTTGIARCSNNLLVANMIAQDGYGTDGKQYLSYEALEQCLSSLCHLDYDDIYCPYYMGCGLAGGNWSRVVELLEKYVPDIIVCRKD